MRRTGLVGLLLLLGCSGSGVTTLDIDGDRLTIRCSVDGLDHDRCIELAMQAAGSFRSEVPGRGELAIEVRQAGSMVVDVCPVAAGPSAVAMACREYPGDP